METIVLIAVIFFLLIFILAKEIIQYIERDKLTNKIMSDNFLEYSNYELAKKSEPQKDKKTNGLTAW